MKRGRYVYAGATVLALVIALGIWRPLNVKADLGRSNTPANFRVDPFWPKPLPAPDGHQWVTGEVGGSCIDSQDHLVTLNRGFQQGLTGQDGTTSVPAPPVIEYDAKGNVVNAWPMDPAVRAMLPGGIHGCFVDYQDNIWIAGNGDGIVQKWSHDGQHLLLQIGTKGVCDGPGGACVSPGLNSSHTLLDNPADVWVDPQEDPVTHKRGSVYIADGYGNHRVVVFDANGNFLRQWGSAGSGPGQFGVADGGHPHCVVGGNDGLIYACDRGQNRIEVFDKLGNLQRIIPVVDATTSADAALPQPDHFVFPACEHGHIDPENPQKGWRTSWRNLTRAVTCPACGRLQSPAETCTNEECKADLRKVKSPIAGLRFHDLRHHAITELAESQASDSTIMSIAGHVS